MDIEQVDDSTTILIRSEKDGLDSKGKTKICCEKKGEDNAEDASANDQGNSVSIAGSEESNNPVKSSTSASISSNSDLSYVDDDEDCDDADDVSDYGDDDDFLYVDDYSIMQSHFDNVDLPHGVEALIPWLKDSAPTGNLPPALGVPTAPTTLADIKLKSTFSDTSMVSRESGSDCKGGGNEEDGDMQKFLSFKHFDVVDDFSDHHYSNMNSSGGQPKEWAKQIQEEWKILEKDLPGPAGTPYHDGLFVFDCFFPPKYPHEPPMVYYYSGGLRLNPNLYNCGKVCLSLLGTWHGSQNEMWVPGQSTMLQVLVSIQALILNATPFFNEPGYERVYVGAEGERKCRKYNEQVFILSLKTMIYTLRKPPKHFEDFVTGHFRNRALDILLACQAYKEGAMIGSVVVNDAVPDPNKLVQGNSEVFKGAIQKMINAMTGVCEKWVNQLRAVSG
ncbi:putative ubiquitin-conjugating enzyme E2 38 [Hibiscus syriacus]|uniref:Ubiquitin-conjugating enzyme E2 38 n=1 Tax=Hibiscus syriacus TaxID=106335 RepID=A0A6A3CT45_HIBSY|nr:putative ubiquitin-conjugating enzyme E2 38 [Hibiscus syriacus]